MDTLLLQPQFTIAALSLRHSSSSKIGYCCCFSALSTAGGVGGASLLCFGWWSIDCCCWLRWRSTAAVAAAASRLHLGCWWGWQWCISALLQLVVDWLLLLHRGSTATASAVALRIDGWWCCVYLGKFWGSTLARWYYSLFGLNFFILFFILCLDSYYSLFGSINCHLVGFNSFIVFFISCLGWDYSLFGLINCHFIWLKLM